MPCDICSAATKAGFKYCPVCGALFLHTKEEAAKVLALKRARREDGFHCEYSGALLNVTDLDDPLYLNFDHRTPGVLNDLAVSGAIINFSKGNLTYLEFPLVVHETVRHWDTGDPFNKDVVPYSAWLAGRPLVKATNARMVDMALLPRLVDAGLLLPAGNRRVCRICEKYAVTYLQKYCPRCRRLLNRSNDETWAVMAAALKRAYLPELDGFICYHLGVVLDTFNWMSPFYLCFDHLVPDEIGNIVVSSVLANRLKTATDEPEWHRYFRNLDRAMRGGDFEQETLEFKYWRPGKKVAGRRVA